MPEVNFSIERWGHFLDDASHLFIKHWEEANDHPNWKLELDHDQFITADHDGLLKIIVGRNQDNKVVAYLMFFVTIGIHYRSHKICTVYNYWVNKKYRGITPKRMFVFFEHVAAELECDEIQIRAKLKKNRANKILEYLGYHPIDVGLIKTVER
jgi:hypothetical protein